MMIDSLSISVVKTDMCYNFQQIQLPCNCEDCQTTVDYYLNARNKYLRKIRERHISRILKSFFFQTYVHKMKLRHKFDILCSRNLIENDRIAE